MLVVNMSAPLDTILNIWDEGWLGRDKVQLISAETDLALIEQYIASPVFRCSFLHGDDPPNQHGPFVADRINATDFLSLNKSDLERYLESIELSVAEPSEEEVEGNDILRTVRNAAGKPLTGAILKRVNRSKEVTQQSESALKKDEAERAKVLPHLCNAFAGGRRCYVLRYDEGSKDVHHITGFVYWLFREFLFVGSSRDSLERFIIGYD